MSKKYLLYIGIFLILTIFYSGFISSSHYACQIEINKNTCESNSGFVVMGVSSSTNAHGELSGQVSGEDDVLCCYFGSDVTTCNQNPDPTLNNEIVGLSAATNAHAEEPGSDIYSSSYDVCYDSLVDCFIGPASHLDNEIPVITLSSTTNAHLGTSYSTQISCVVTSTSACTLTSASWSTNETSEGQSVNLIVQGNNCDGETISFEVWEDDVTGDDSVTTNPIDVQFSGNTATGTWTAEWQDDGATGGDPEYYFNATLVSTGAYILSSMASEDLLTVTQFETDICTGIATCGDYSDATSCNADECSVADDTPPCDPATQTCDCVWDDTGGQCDLIAIANSVCGNGVREAGEVCDGSDLDSRTCTTEGFSGGDLGCWPAGTLDSGGGDIGCQGYNYTACIGFTCDNDGTRETGEVCDGNDFSKAAGGLWECSDFDDFSDGDLNCEACQIVTNDCTFDLGTDVGGCIYRYLDTGDTCDNDGILEVEWIVEWTGSGSPPASCQPGKDAYACPAQIALPFFNMLNLLITILIIAAIYAVMINRRRH